MTAKKNNLVRGIAILMVVAMLLGIVGTSIVSFAATATVGGTNVNVRDTPSTSGSVVGTANTGDTFEVGEPETASDGSKWYQVTLSNGNTGYIRSDLLSVTEDPEPTSTETPSSTEPAASTQEPVPTSAAEPDPVENEKYQLVNVPDAAGNDVYYVYDYEDGLRIKVEDLSQYDTIKTNAEKFEKAAGRYRVILIILGILLLALLAALGYLIMRLRNALSHDVDISDERRDPRRLGNRNAGKASATEGRRVSRRSLSGRNDKPYASGRGEEAAAPRTARPGAKTAARPAQPRAEQGARPVQRPQGSRPAAPQAAQQPAQPVRRPVSTGDQGPVQVKRPAQPRNFALDDDLDYGFLNKKD